MALIPPFAFNCVVAIGIKDSSTGMRWVGTGTLVGRLFKKTDANQGQYHIFIVTNKHIFENQESLVVRFNPLASTQAKDFDIPLYNKAGDPFWKSHPKGLLDIAAIGINAEFLNQEGICYDFFQSDNHFMTLKEMKEEGVSEGDFIYVLGFPMGIVDPDRQYVIARSGIIARLRDTLEGHKDDFLIDAFVFPGNSGGPVLYKPEIISIEGTRSITRPAFMGIVDSYLTYKDTAVSQQTGHQRVVFEENSGLATVVPTDGILETMEACFATMKIKEKDFVPSPGPGT